MLFITWRYASHRLLCFFEHTPFKAFDIFIRHFVNDNSTMHVSIVGWFMVLNASFNNISVKLWRSVLLVEETNVPGENH